MPPTFFQEVMAKIAGKKAADSAATPPPKGEIIMGRTAEESEKPVTGNHLIYGQGPNISAVSRNETAQRVLNENMLRKAYDPYHKAIRVICTDEFPQ